jgi:hypothetical protein
MGFGIGDIVKYLFREWRLIRRFPVSFAAAVLVVGVLIWIAMEWRYRGIIEIKVTTIGALNDEKARLRVALGVDPATPTALISLNNKELAAKATTVVVRLREFAKEYNDGLESIRKQTNLTKEQMFAQQQTLANDIGAEYTKEIKSDAHNVDFELRRRLGPKQVAGIIGISPSVVARDGARMDILQIAALASPVMELGTLSTMAFGIEQMAKLLPDKG